jgi:hypothetical protein
MENDYLESLYAEELYRIPPKTTIVITQPWSDLKEEEKEQLAKITEALRQRIHPRLSLVALAIVSVSSLDLSTWVEKPDRLIYFGPAIKGLTNYELIQADGTQMVLSESLADLIPNEASRTKLWQALRQLFSPQGAQ